MVTAVITMRILISNNSKNMDVFLVKPQSNDFPSSTYLTGRVLLVIFFDGVHQWVSIQNIVSKSSDQSYSDSLHSANNEALKRRPSS